MFDNSNDPAMAELAKLLKNKLQASEKLDVLESLTPNIRKRVDTLRDLQGQHDEIEAKFFEERAAIEAKYQKLYEPLYTKRSEIVNGKVEVEGVTNETSTEQGEEKALEEKGVPNFWLTAMKTHEILAEVISDRDEGALKYLEDIKWARIDNPKGFKLELFFDTNPYFKNDVLTKTYHMIDEDEPTLEKAIGTEIEWHPGKCLTQKILKKQPKKGSTNAKPITKNEDCDSFFKFFTPPDVDGDNIDDDTAEELQDLMEKDYEIGSAIRDKIIPHAVSWFTGEAAEDDEVDEDEDEDEDDDDDEVDDEDDEVDDEDDEDEDEDDDKDELPKNRKKTSARSKEGGRAQKKQGQWGEHPPECKQQ